MKKFFRSLVDRCLCVLLPVEFETIEIKGKNVLIIEKETQAAPESQNGAQRNFVHLVGDFSGSRFKVDGREVDVARIDRVAAKGGISEHFKICAGGTTYVLWNNSDEHQRKIQEGRKNHFMIEKGENQVVSLSDKSFEVVNARQYFVSTATPPPPLSVPDLKKPEARMAWCDYLEQEVSRQNKITRERFAASEFFTAIRQRQCTPA